MILFLDFDGVLHPDGCRPERQFAALPLVEDVVREFPGVEIVISSAWRLDYAKTQEAVLALRAHFSRDIQHRIVGVTGDASNVSFKDMPFGLDTYVRQAECMGWLQMHRPAFTPWLALDDGADLFQPLCPNLMLLDGQKGFLPAHEEVLRAHLRTHTHSHGQTGKGGV